MPKNAPQQIIDQNSDPAISRTYADTLQGVPLGSANANIFITNTTQRNFINYVNVSADAAGSNEEIQFNVGNHFAADAGLTYNASTDSLTVTGNVNAGNIRTDHLLYANGVAWNLGSGNTGNANLGSWTFDTYTATTDNNIIIQAGAGTGAWASLLSNDGNNSFWVDNDGAHVTTDFAGSENYWNFGVAGTIEFPNSFLKSPVDNPLYIQTTTSDTDDNQLNFNPKSIDLYAYNSNDNSYAELYLDNSNTIAPTASIIVKRGTGTEQSWIFSNNGTLTLPGAGVQMLAQTNVLLTSGISNATIGTLAQGPQGSISWEYLPDGGNANTGYGAIGLSNETLAGTQLNFKIELASDNGNSESDHVWIFDATGNITFPDGNVQTTAYLGSTGAPTLQDITESGSSTNQALTITNTTGSSGTATGALTVHGGIGANGNIHGTQIHSIGNMFCGGDTLFVGPSADATEFTNCTILAFHAGETYIQAAIKNSDPNGTGSSDWVAYGQNGTDISGWTDMGFSDENFSDPAYTITNPGDGYFFVQSYNTTGGNLVLATGELGTVGDIVFATGGFSAENEVVRIVNAVIPEDTQLQTQGSVSVGTFLKLTPGTAPSAPTEGTVYYDSSAHAIKVYTNTGWKTLAFSE